MSSYCYCTGVRRQAAIKAGQGRVTEDTVDIEDTEGREDNDGTLDIEDTVDQLVTGQEMERCEEKEAAEMTNQDDITVINIE